MRMYIELNAIAGMLMLMFVIMFTKFTILVQCVNLLPFANSH